MKRERRQKLSKAEWERITSNRPVVRRIARSEKQQAKSRTNGGTR